MLNTGYHTYNDVVSYLEKNFPGEGFENGLDERLSDFMEEKEETLVTPDPYSVEIAKQISKLKIQRPSIFLIGNGNLRFLFLDEEKSVGIQIRKDSIQVVTLVSEKENENV